VGSGDEYLRFAAECIALAEKISDPSGRARLLAMALAWQKLADFINSAAILRLKVPDDDQQS
jgi:hypothetical protein